MISEEQRRLEKLNFSSNIGYTVKAALHRAQDEERVIIGLSAAVKSLSKTPSDALFCLIAPPAAGDYATHMQEVLLQAYCFENDIYIVKVDSSEKLSKILDTSNLESCALVQRKWDAKSQKEIISKIEDNLIDHCESYWDAPRQPIISLPES